MDGTLEAREKIVPYLDCGAAYRVTWKFGNVKHNLESIIEHIRAKSQKDSMAEEIWSHMPTKFSLILLWFKWKQIKPLRSLNAQGIPV